MAAAPDPNRPLWQQSLRLYGKSMFAVAALFAALDWAIFAFHGRVDWPREILLAWCASVNLAMGLCVFVLDSALVYLALLMAEDRVSPRPASPRADAFDIRFRGWLVVLYTALNILLIRVVGFETRLPLFLGSFALAYLGLSGALLIFYGFAKRFIPQAHEVLARVAKGPLEKLMDF